MPGPRHLMMGRTFVLLLLSNIDLSLDALGAGELRITKFGRILADLVQSFGSAMLAGNVLEII